MSKVAKHNKQAEVTAESLLKLAHGHTWFAKDAAKRAKSAQLSADRLVNKAVSRMHRETANVLRNEAKRVRQKP